jgi:hypothetical protein
MTSATASDYKSAVGAALAAGDSKTAETWLRYGLDAYPRDAEMLTLGAKFEQLRGNSGRAADYFRASLAALPPSDPGAELANELSQPVPIVRLPKPAEPQDLVTLLGSTGTDGLDAGAQSAPPARPYLPNYGNLSGEAPVQVNGGGVYNGTSSVVPSYRANPESRRSQAPAEKGRLRDYVPQASNSQPAVSGYDSPPLQASAAMPGGQSSQDFQRQQIQLLTEQAQAQQPPISAVQQQETYGPTFPMYRRRRTPATLLRPSRSSLGITAPATHHSRVKSPTFCLRRGICRTPGPLRAPAP